MTMPQDEQPASAGAIVRELPIINKRGLHARASAKFVQMAEKFDAEQTYRRRWIAEISRHPPASAQSYFDATPRAWRLDPARPYPMPLIDLAEGRARALDALASKGPKEGNA